MCSSDLMFVATLGHSRRLHVRAFRHEQQASWFSGLESAFTSFCGVPEEVLMDDPRALVVRHDAASRQVTFNDKLIAFARHWSFRPRACAPYRARTKGKTENGVGYVKKNCASKSSQLSKLLPAMAQRPSFGSLRELTRVVGNDCAVESTPTATRCRGASSASASP